jgi:hypothetical protein
MDFLLSHRVAGQCPLWVISGHQLAVQGSAIFNSGHGLLKRVCKRKKLKQPSAIARQKVWCWSRLRVTSIFVDDSAASDCPGRRTVSLSIIGQRPTGRKKFALSPAHLDAARPIHHCSRIQVTSNFCGFYGKMTLRLKPRREPNEDRYPWLLTRSPPRVWHHRHTSNRDKPRRALAFFSPRGSACVTNKSGCHVQGMGCQSLARAEVC